MILHDERLPGFARSFDMAFMRQALESGLPSLGQVRSCRLERFRYRKQSRASFLYEVETGDGSGWISGSLYKGEKSRGIFEAAGGHCATGYAPELGMVLERFPHDRKLGLASLLTAGDCHDVLEVIAPMFGGASLAVTETTPVRYRPRIAAVFRIAVRSAQTTRRFYVKIYADEDVRAIRDRLMRANDGALFSILRPVAVIERHNAIVWPEIDGMSLAQSLIAGESLEAMQQGARALAEFHESRQALVPIPPSVYAQEDASRHAAFITSVVPGLEGAADSLVREIPRPFGKTPVGPFHHDMKPEHTMIGGGKANFIDVEGISLGDPAFDVGNMLARISAGPWLYGSSATQSKRAFETFLGNSLPLPHDGCAAAYALGKMKLATYAISHQIHDWAATAKSEIEEAIAALKSKAFD